MTIRNLKALGLALAAVFALSALSASGSSAQTTVGKLTVNGGTSVTLDATEIGVNRFAWTATEFVECPGSTLTGHEFRTTPHVPIPFGASKVTLTAKLESCFAEDSLGKHKATVTMTTCDYEAEVGETTGGVANTYGVKFSIRCNTAGDRIDIDVYAFANSELGGIQCTIKIKEQSGLAGTHLTTDTVNDDLSISGEIEGIHAERSGSGCATETKTNATQPINYTVKGTNASTGSTGITVTH
jgi:hypothetical protein